MKNKRSSLDDDNSGFNSHGNRKRYLYLRYFASSPFDFLITHQIQDTYIKRRQQLLDLLRINIRNTNG